MILEGETVANRICTELKKRIERCARKPSLAVILVGDNPPSEIYVSLKIKRATQLGIAAQLIRLEKKTSQSQILSEIEKLNEDPSVDGILLQLPLPRLLDTEAIVNAILPSKDVDGLHPMNLGKLLAGYSDGFVPCTPAGICELLRAYDIETVGRDVVILGRSNIVGKPLAALLMQKGPYADASVTILHSSSQNINRHLKDADIIISAMGQPLFLTQNMINEKAVVIDVGISRIDTCDTPKGYRIVGDVDFNNVVTRCRGVSPVPKGVGPLTIAMLMRNTCLSYSKELFS